MHDYECFSCDNWLDNIRLDYDPSAINIYVTPLDPYDDEKDNGGRANGLTAYLFPSQNSQNYRYVALSLSIGGTINGEDVLYYSLAHEVGHVLGLIHTHEKKETCAELVDESNCTTCGDLICDTKATPDLQFSVNSIDDANCQYIGNAADANGMAYNPDTRNYMSYSLLHCLDEFTPQQGARMRGFLATFYDLQNVIIPENISVQNLTMSSASTPLDKYYKAYGTIHSQNVSLTGNTNLAYVAGDAVIIDKDFVADLNSHFVAEIDETQCNHLTSLNSARGGVSDETQFNDFLSAMGNSSKTSISPAQESLMNIFPNPANTEISISFSNINWIAGMITLTDALGNKVLTTNCNANNFKIDVSALVNGLYYINYTNSKDHGIRIHNTVLISR